MDATKTLSHFVAETDFESFPVSVVEAAKVAILDGVANMMALAAMTASNKPWQYEVNLFKQWAAVKTFLPWLVQTPRPSIFRVERLSPASSTDTPAWTVRD